MQRYNNFQWNKLSQYGTPKTPHTATTFYTRLNDLELCFLSWESEIFAYRFVILEIRATLAQTDFLKKLGFHFISFVQTTALHGIHWKSEIKLNLASYWYYFSATTTWNDGITYQYFYIHHAKIGKMRHFSVWNLIS